MCGRRVLMWRSVYISLTVALAFDVFVGCTHTEAGFAIETYVVTDSLIQNRIRESGLTLGAFVFDLATQLNAILVQLPRPGSVIITGLRSTKPSDEPYRRPKRGTELHCRMTQANAATYSNKHKLNNNADLVLVLIGRKMYCSPRGTKVLAHGITNVGSACTKTNVIVMTADREPEKFVLTAAHEIGHALGAPHDDNDAIQGCSPYDRHIMAPSMNLRRLTTYSECSKRAIQNFLSSDAASCLLNRRCPSSAMTKEEQEQMKKDQCWPHVRETENFLNATVVSPCLLSCNTELWGTSTVASFDKKAPDAMSCGDEKQCKVCNGGICV
ncbi:venom metalloproteinase antarease-like TpachMP_B [Rhipicephalus microplus]|uniref:venom metalloproteinase antarease-like TpachMP_B n=1 Tax=Rhipicephalus microplus TaxID=6941 RepID=UPI003F6BFC5A